MHPDRNVSAAMSKIHARRARGPGVKFRLVYWLADPTQRREDLIFARSRDEAMQRVRDEANGALIHWVSITLA